MSVEHNKSAFGKSAKKNVSMSLCQVHKALREICCCDSCDTVRRIHQLSYRHRLQDCLCSNVHKDYIH